MEDRAARLVELARALRLPQLTTIRAADDVQGG
jgi:hypothetical protein